MKLTRLYIINRFRLKLITSHNNKNNTI